MAPGLTDLMYLRQQHKCVTINRLGELNVLRGE